MTSSQKPRQPVAPALRRGLVGRRPFSWCAVLYGLVRMVPLIPTAMNRVPVQVTPRIRSDVGISLGAVHVSPSLLYTMVPRSPTATNRVPPQMTSCSQSPSGYAFATVQVSPSALCTINPSSPTATNRDPLQATA